MKFNNLVLTCSLFMFIQSPIYSMELFKKTMNQQRSKSKWELVSNGKFSFWKNEKEIGDMKLNFSSKDSRANIIVCNERYVLKKTGFWKNNLELATDERKLIAITKLEKNNSKSVILEYQDQKFEIITQNNPMSEIAILREGKSILSYSLSYENGNLNIRISEGSDEVETLFHFIIWYLYYPIAQDSMGNDYRFTSG